MGQVWWLKGPLAAVEVQLGRSPGDGGQRPTLDFGRPSCIRCGEVQSCAWSVGTGSSSTRRCQQGSPRCVKFVWMGRDSSLLVLPGAQRTCPSGYAPNLPSCPQLRPTGWRPPSSALAPGMQLAGMARRRASCPGTSRRQCHHSATRSPPALGSPLVPASPPAWLSVTVHAHEQHGAPAPLHVPNNDYNWLRSTHAAGTPRRHRHHGRHGAQHDITAGPPHAAEAAVTAAAASLHAAAEPASTASQHGYDADTAALPPVIVPKRLPAAVKFSSPLSDVIFFPEPSGKLPCRCAAWLASHLLC